jgi:hypothetical protein
MGVLVRDLQAVLSCLQAFEDLCLCLPVWQRSAGRRGPRGCVDRCQLRLVSLSREAAQVCLVL